MIIPRFDTDDINQGMFIPMVDTDDINQGVIIPRVDTDDLNQSMFIPMFDTDMSSVWHGWFEPRHANPMFTFFVRLLYIYS